MVRHHRQGGKRPVIASGSRSLGPRQTAYDAEVGAIEAAVEWYQDADFHMVVHSDSTSAIARVQQPGAGPAQSQALRIYQIIGSLLAFHDRTDPMGERTRRHPGQREGRSFSGYSGRTQQLVPGHLPRVPQAPDVGKIPGSERRLARRPKTLWGRGNPTSAA